MASASASGAAVSREPAFLAARRARAAELQATLAPPTYKGRPGWEFTDLSALDLAAYAAPNGDDAGAPAASRARACSIRVRTQSSAT